MNTSNLKYVAILILLESFLQYNKAFKKFIGILSAILLHALNKKVCNSSRNPYFIGILSAIERKSKRRIYNNSRNPYFIGILSAILT